MDVNDNPCGTVSQFYSEKCIFITGATGKSLSEVLIHSSINPQYDNKLFNDLRVQYNKIPRAEHAKNMSRTCQEHVIYTNCFECISKKYENLTQISIV